MAAVGNKVTWQHQPSGPAAGKRRPWPGEETAHRFPEGALGRFRGRTAADARGEAVGGLAGMQDSHPLEGGQEGRQQHAAAGTAP